MMPMNQQQGQQPTVGNAVQPTQTMQQNGSGNGQPDPYSFIKEVFDLLVMRIQNAAQKKPGFGQAIDEGVSPEAAEEIYMILPEMKVIYESIAGAGDDQGPITSPAPQAQGQVSDNPLVRDGMASRGLVG